jgi:hypothetical protein
MQWSKLKSRIKDRIAPEFRDRVDFHLTSYRKSHDGSDKVWIVIDGVRIFSCNHYRSERATAEAFYSGLPSEQIKSHLNEREIHTPRDFGEAMRLYLDMPIADALSSSNPLVKAFTILDRRVGERTIAALEIPDSEHTLVKAFYKLRRPNAHLTNACSGLAGE